MLGDNTTRKPTKKYPQPSPSLRPVGFRKKSPRNSAWVARYWVISIQQAAACDPFVWPNAPWPGLVRKRMYICRLGTGKLENQELNCEGYWRSQKINWLFTTCLYNYIPTITPWKTNIERENESSGKKMPIGNPHFQVPCQFFGGAAGIFHFISRIVWMRLCCWLHKIWYQLGMMIFLATNIAN